MSDPSDTTTKVSAAFQQLEAAASRLNSVSNELGKSIESLDSVLKRLNLGIATWIEVEGHEDNYSGQYWSRDLGYARIGSRWGIALRERDGNYNAEPDSGNYDEWLFNDAPRALRIKAIDKLPELLEALIKTATSTAEKISDKVAHAQQVVEAVGGPRPAGKRK